MRLSFVIEHIGFFCFSASPTYAYIHVVCLFVRTDHDNMNPSVSRAVVTIWSEVQHRLTRFVENASRVWLGKHQCHHSVSNLISEYAVEDIVLRTTTTGVSFSCHTTVDGMLALRKPLQRCHINAWLLAIRLMCQHVASCEDNVVVGHFAHLGQRKRDAKEEEDNNDGDKHEASLADAMTLTACDVFVRSLCEPRLELNIRAMPYVALAACTIAAGWFGLEDGRSWERLALNVKPFRHVVMRAVCVRCLPVILILVTTPRPGDVPCGTAVLTDAQRFYGHPNMDAVLSSPAAIDFYVGSHNDRIRLLEDSKNKNGCCI